MSVRPAPACDPGVGCGGCEAPPARDGDEGLDRSSTPHFRQPCVPWQVLSSLLCCTYNG